MATSRALPNRSPLVSALVRLAAHSDLVADRLPRRSCAALLRGTAVRVACAIMADDAVLAVVQLRAVGWSFRRKETPGLQPAPVGARLTLERDAESAFMALLTCLRVLTCARYPQTPTTRTP